jgi:hypothetical protein
MNRTKLGAVCAAIAATLLVASVADADDDAKPAPATDAVEPAKDVPEPAKPAEVQKNKTRSNQSNDRQAAPAPAKEGTDAPPPDEVLKTKTKSNQSND